jgi:HAD superfamily hydrolase (TIGR01509 family)
MKPKLISFNESSAHFTSAIKLLIFDFSGTLAYLSKPIDFKEFFASLKKFGIEITTDEDINAFTSLFADLLGFAKNWLDFSEKLFEEYVDKPEREIIEKLAKFLEKNVSFEFYDDVKEIFDLPMQKAVLSANAEFIIKSLGLEEFAKVFTPRETKFLKPDPRAFLAVLEKLKVKPEETLMVGDELERDLIPAKKLGMETILIDRENKTENASVKKINSLVELKEILF